MTEDISTRIAELENQRYAAMLAGDAAALERLLDERLRYVHSSGHVDGKASYIDGVRARRTVYHHIAREEQTIVALDNTAMVFNILRLDVTVGGVARKVHSRALAVWNRTDGDWRLAGVLSAAMPAA